MQKACENHRKAGKEGIALAPRRRIVRDAITEMLGIDLGRLLDLLLRDLGSEARIEPDLGTKINQNRLKMRLFGPFSSLFHPKSQVGTTCPPK